jgi:hypothetical protein
VGERDAGFSFCLTCQGRYVKPQRASTLRFGCLDPSRLPIRPQNQYQYRSESMEFYIGSSINDTITNINGIGILHKDIKPAKHPP